MAITIGGGFQKHSLFKGGHGRYPFLHGVSMEKKGKFQMPAFLPLPMFAWLSCKVFDLGVLGSLDPPGFLWKCQSRTAETQERHE